MTEGLFQQSVIELAEVLGWKVYHVSNVKGRLRSKSGEGFPDLVLVREITLFAECKNDVRQPTEDQDAWLVALHESGQYSGVWRPRDWSKVSEILSSRWPPETLPEWRGEWRQETARRVIDRECEIH